MKKEKSNQTAEEKTVDVKKTASNSTKKTSAATKKSSSTAKKSSSTTKKTSTTTRKTSGSAKKTKAENRTKAIDVEENVEQITVEEILEAARSFALPGEEAAEATKEAAEATEEVVETAEEAAKTAEDNADAKEETVDTAEPAEKTDEKKEPSDAAKKAAVVAKKAGRIAAVAAKKIGKAIAVTAKKAAIVIGKAAAVVGKAIGRLIARLAKRFGAWVKENFTVERKEIARISLNGLIFQNPTFVLLLGMCPTLATTTSLKNGLAMGLCAASVLVCSNLVISLLRKVIPKQIRIASYIVIIATFVTAVDLLMQAFAPNLSKSLGLYIPLIVVNCIILGRAEAFAAKNKPGSAFLDGLFMGLGFTGALAILGAIREILGAGTIWGIALPVISEYPVGLILSPCGGFITLGCLIALVQFLRRPRKGGSKA